jgi:hypothetical protein
MAIEMAAPLRRFMHAVRQHAIIIGRAGSGRWPASLLAGALVALASCAAPGASVGPPPAVPPPPPATPGCSPGWTMGPDGRCHRDPSNFGGPPIYFGPQVRVAPTAPAADQRARGSSQRTSG